MTTSISTTYTQNVDGPFDKAQMLGYRLSTAVILSNACLELADMDNDIQRGLEDLDLPQAVRAQILHDFKSVDERWNLLFSTCFYVD